MITEPGKQKNPRQLPTLKLKNGKAYFVDERLKQLRNVNDPHDFIDY